ncbi:glycosyltransferase, group 2 family protein [Paenibacillus sp. oral taxon 786 str. D14]|uniref:glycosyltransferase family 2 protein n=1 Tax=Paenibacillus sp. oral taxon 786 TaxID=652715 RepID=UPI0001AFD86C|nr:glycosyltransferase family 2 protein [Paenibacillus sp. oral taxon 786]EES72759.1 glycosyltransferase, group 2 family protein [Paenibacillus sp. oral taxon 786 str. D14]
MNPSVTIQIVTYNSANDIAECLDGVRLQTYPIQEIIVIDNASKDETVERVRAYIEQTHVNNIHLVVNPTNTGFAPAHNQGICMTQSDYVLVLNPDVQLGTEYVERLVGIMEQRPEVGSATGLLILKSSPDVVDSTGIVMNGIWRAFDRGAGGSASQWRESGEVFGVSGAAAMYRRAMIDELSIDGEFFDADFFAYKEDVDVAWRANLLGWKAYYCAEAVATHERGWKKGSRHTQPLFIRQYSYINRYKMIYKNLSGYRWIQHLPKLLAYELASNGYMLLREPKVLGAWKDFFDKLPELREKRREIQRRKSK